MTATKTMTTADLAAALDTDPRTLRKFLRDTSEGVGKGKRYSLPGTATALKKFGKDFAAWSTAQADRKAAPEVPAPDAEPMNDLEAEIDHDAAMLEGPSDDELDDITAELDD